MTDGSNKTTAGLVIEGKHQAGEVALQLLQQANREICFFGPMIDRFLFDNEKAIDCISAFARNSRYSQVRIAVHSTQKNVADSHRLLPLAQKLSSKIHIHQCDEQHQDQHDLFLLVDNNGYLICHNASRYLGHAALQDRAQNHKLLKRFEKIWAHSVSDVYSRRLNL